MPAVPVAQEHEIEFVAKFLGPALRKAGAATKIFWVLTTTTNLWGPGDWRVEQCGKRTNTSMGLRRHGYVGEPSAMTRVQ